MNTSYTQKNCVQRIEYLYYIPIKMYKTFNVMDTNYIQKVVHKHRKKSK